MSTWQDARLPVRFWSKVQRSKNGCWHWTGTLDKHGYSRFSLNDGFKRSWCAHRWAFHTLVHPLTASRGEPGHLQVDHECHNRSKSCKGGPTCMHRRCVNPAHLRAVPARTNCLAGKTPAARNAVATRCIYGHEFVPENIYLDRDGHRSCKRCKIDQGRELRRAKSALIDHGPHYQTVKTECPYGHPYSGDNLVIRPDGARGCRACRKQRSVEYQERQRGGPLPGHFRDRTHCVRGHPLSGDNLYVAPGSGKRACRTCKRAGEAAKRKPPKPLRTHCPSGHPYSGENLYVSPGAGDRHCRTCMAARRAARTREETQRRHADS